jgi:signal transduction histidine kinase
VPAPPLTGGILSIHFRADALPYGCCGDRQCRCLDGRTGAGGLRSPTTFRIAWSVPWGLFCLTCALLISAVVLSLAGGVDWSLLVWLGFAGVGALIAARTSNKVGWLFLAEGLALALANAAKAYASRTGGAPLPGAPWAGWILTIALNAVFPPLSLALLLFPDGRLPSPRWRPMAWAAVASGAVGVACNAVSDVNFSSNFPHLNDPVTLVRAGSLDGVYNGTLVFGPLIFLLCAASLIVRLVRSRGEQRLQLKWFVFASALASSTVAVASFVLPDPSMAFTVFVPLIPIGAGVAIFKYRLYDIDVVINKTVVFGTLAAFITAVYVAIVVGIGAAIGQGSKPNLGLSILATGVVAVAFQPVRERVQRFANRLVYGVRATPYEVLSEFSSRMAGAYESEYLLPRMARILAEGTGAGSAHVWLKVGNELRAEATWPGADDSPALPMKDDVLPPMPDASLVLPVRHRDDLLGALSLTKLPGERLTPTEETLAADLASGAGLVLRNVRLTEELLARLDDLRASRQRLVAAQDQERRRIERNLHDGAQQQLVALAVKQRLVAVLVGRDPEKAAAMMEELQADTTEALENLRDLARGIYPPLLADQGLAAALASQARKATFPVSIEAAHVGRYPQEAEAAVYFCCLEALQNVAKYAGATHATIRLHEQDGQLTFEVTDDGAGFDSTKTSYGTGLQGIADRLSAQGGTLGVTSTPGEGTTVTGRLRVPVLEPVSK